MTSRNKNWPGNSIVDFAPLRGFALCFFLFFFHGSPVRATQQSTSPAPNSQAQQPGVAQAPPDANKPAAAIPSPQQPAKPHKVITNDDIKAFHARDNAKVAAGKDAGIFPTGECDADCTQLVREELGFGPEQEGEWQFRLATARQALGADSQWRADQLELSRVEKESCDFQYQLQSATLPSGNDWNSGVERARRQEYAENMGRTLAQGISNATARMNQHINDVRGLDPVRAAMMEVLESRLMNSCSDDDSN
jgi:hypothetical protein